MSRELPDGIEKWKLILGGIGFLVLGVLLLPTLQSIVYQIVFGAPGFTQWTIIALIFIGVGIYKNSEASMAVGAIIFCVFALFLGPLAGGAYAHTDMANQVQQDSTELDTLPNTSSENVRVLPRNVSDTYATSSMQEPKYQLTRSDIAYHNGSYAWSYGVIPDNLVVSVTGNQNGVLYTDMTTTEKNVEMNRETFKNGRGQLLFDSYVYQSVLSEPLKQHQWDTTFNANGPDGTPYIAHSTVTYNIKFKLFPVPQFYSVPEHSTVEVMYQNGTIESMSPEEAQDSELLRGQNFYPYEVANFKVDSMRYVDGALNAWFTKEGVIKIANLPDNGNDWPITVPTENPEGPELTYFIAAEPAGSGNGIYEIWTIDSQTGETAYQRYSDSQIGPQKAVDYTESTSEVNRLKSANAVAPIPIIKGDTLFWQVKVIPESGTGVIYTAFVNAESGDVTLLEGTEPIYAFLTEEEVSQVKQQSQNETKSSGTTVKVVVTDGNGTITGTENITIPEGGDVSIDISANNSTATA